MRSSVLSLALFCVVFGSLATAAAALAPNELKPAFSADEQSFYATLSGADAQNFLITRKYVRQAQAVVDGKMNPLSFPAKKPAGFTVAYLLPDDPTVINNALGMYLTAKYSGQSSPWAIA